MKVKVLYKAGNYVTQDWTVSTRVTIVRNEAHARRLSCTLPTMFRARIHFTVNDVFA